MGGRIFLGNMTRARRNPCSGYAPPSLPSEGLTVDGPNHGPDLQSTLASIRLLNVLPTFGTETLRSESGYHDYSVKLIFLTEGLGRTFRVLFQPS